MYLLFNVFFHNFRFFNIILSLYYIVFMLEKLGFFAMISTQMINIFPKRVLRSKTGMSCPIDAKIQFLTKFMSDIIHLPYNIVNFIGNKACIELKSCQFVIIMIQKTFKTSKFLNIFTRTSFG